MLDAAKASNDPLPIIGQSNINWEASQGEYTEMLHKSMENYGVKKYAIIQAGDLKAAAGQGQQGAPCAAGQLQEGRAAAGGHALQEGQIVLHALQVQVVKARIGVVRIGHSTVPQVRHSVPQRHRFGKHQFALNPRTGRSTVETKWGRIGGLWFA